VGATGSAGATGATGNALLYGAGAPAQELGTDGNFYLDTSGQALYGPKVGGQWPVGTNLAGSTGATGGTGAEGAQGLQGPTGAAGANGATGATGPTGATGVAGTNGATGATGAAGATGATGATGPTGATGTAGTNGATGAPGAAGTAGATGATGPAPVLRQTFYSPTSTTVNSYTATNLSFNNGGATTYSIYTVPATGIYYIKFNVRITTAASKYFYLQSLIKSGSSIIAMGPYVSLPSAGASAAPNISSQAIFMGSLTTGTVLTFSTIGTSNTSATNANSGKAAVTFVQSASAVEGETNVFIYSFD
jgi:hypothetical protein